MKKHQIVLPIENQEVYSRESWINDESNIQAISWVDKWPEWPWPHIVCINGEAACGKTHLANLWSQKTGGMYINAAHLPAEIKNGKDLNNTNPYSFFINDSNVIAKHNSCIALDNVDNIKNEEWLFHFYNFVQEHKINVLLTSLKAPSQWPITLSDLSSRLATVISVTICHPTDEILARVIIKQFNDLGLIVEHKVIDYLIKHCDRSLGSVYRLVKFLNKAAAREGRAITIPLIRELLEIA